jgi:hypothetical protein
MENDDLVEHEGIFNRMGHERFVSEFLGKQAPTEETEPEYGAINKLFTQDVAEKARALIRSKLNQLSSGIDPELLQTRITMTEYHTGASGRSFAEYSKAIINDFGEAIKPFLRSFYEGTGYYPGLETDGMTAPKDIDEAAKKRIMKPNPQDRRPPMKPQPLTKEDRDYKNWVLKTARRFQEDETEPWPRIGATQTQQSLVELWKHHRPKMYQQLKQMGILKQTAYVQECKMLETADKYREAGMPRNDARMEASKEWLMKDPEEPDEIG